MLVWAQRLNRKVYGKIRTMDEGEGSQEVVDYFAEQVGRVVRPNVPGVAQRQPPVLKDQQVRYFECSC